MLITTNNIIEAAKEGYSVKVIINGEAYELAAAAPANDPIEAAFIEGVKFAAAVIEDDRARANSVFEGIRTIKRVSKAATEANRIRNGEARHYIRHLLYITQSGIIAPWKEDYKNGKLWKLPEND